MTTGCLLCILCADISIELLNILVHTNQLAFDYHCDRYKILLPPTPPPNRLTRYVCIKLGQLKNVLQIAGGFLFFDVPIVPMNIFGISVGISGSFIYTYAKYQENGGRKAVN